MRCALQGDAGNTVSALLVDYLSCLCVITDRNDVAWYSLYGRVKDKT